MILRRLPDSRFSEIVRAWEGKVILLGGGPSLTLELFAQAEIARKSGRAKVIAVNDSYLLAPWADGLYAADASWHNTHRKGVAKPKLQLSAAVIAERYASFPGWVCSVQTQYQNITDERVHIVRDKDLLIAATYNMSAGTNRLIAGRNSLHQALNLAVSAGATTGILLGCDGRPSPDGLSHWHGGHAGKPIPDQFWAEMRSSFSASENEYLRRGVKVINCSPGGAINSFEKMDLADALRVQHAQGDAVLQA